VPAGKLRGKEWRWLTTEGVAYLGPRQVEVRDIDFPTAELKDGPGVNPANVGRKPPHAAILKVVSTNICRSDQHMVRGRTTAPEDQLMQMILNDRAHIATAVNATVLSLEDAPQGYKDFDRGVAKKFVLDPHGMIKDAKVSRV
jgi:threonine dehydrogenase-like Zn-dependent dehydrogenase